MLQHAMGLYWTRFQKRVYSQVNISAECTIVRDTLRGDDANEFRVRFTSQKAEAYPYKDDD